MNKNKDNFKSNTHLVKDNFMSNTQVIHKSNSSHNKYLFNLLDG